MKAGSIEAHFRYCRCCCLALRHFSCQQALPGKARPLEAGPAKAGSIEALPGKALPGEAGAEKTHKTVQNFPSALALNRNAFPGPGSEA